MANKTCKDCKSPLKIKYHYRGCSYTFKDGEKKSIDFYYCPICGLVYYFKQGEQNEQN